MKKLQFIFNWNGTKIIQEIILPDEAATMIVPENYLQKNHVLHRIMYKNKLYEICFNSGENYVSVYDLESRSRDGFLLIIRFDSEYPSKRKEVYRNPKKKWGLMLTAANEFHFTERIPISYGDIFSQEIILPERWVCLICNKYNGPVWNIMNPKEELIIQLYLHIQEGDQFLRAEWKKSKNVPAMFLYFDYKKHHYKEKYLFRENGTTPWGLKLDENGYTFIE
jgi:curved DNA-binding protein CbpA